MNIMRLLFYLVIISMISNEWSLFGSSDNSLFHGFFRALRTFVPMSMLWRPGGNDVNYHSVFETLTEKGPRKYYERRNEIGGASN